MSINVKQQLKDLSPGESFIYTNKVYVKAKVTPCVLAYLPKNVVLVQDMAENYVGSFYEETLVIPFV